MRQHRNDAVDQIHAAAAVVRFLVQPGVFAHIVTDIGDMHTQPDIAAWQPLHMNGIVQVLGVLAVDRHDHFVPQVAPSLTRDLLFFDHIGRFKRFRQHILRKSLRKLVLADNRQDVDARIVLVAENFAHLADGRGPAFRIFHDLHDDFFAVHRAPKTFLRDENITVNPLVVRNHEPVRFMVLEHPDHFGDRPVYDAYDFAFQFAASGAFGTDANENRVAVHRAFQVVRMNVHIRMIPILGDEERKPLSMRLQTPAHQIHPFRHTIPVGTGQNNLPFLFQTVQQLEKLFEVGGIGNPEMLLKLLIRHRFISLFPHKGKQLLFCNQIQMISPQARPVLLPGCYLQMNFHEMPHTCYIP